VSRGGEQLDPFVGPELLALGPGLISNDVQESVAALARLLCLFVHDVPSPEDFYFLLGCNVVVPPYVREALSSRSLDYDEVLGQLTVPVLITHGEEDAIILTSMAAHNAEKIRTARVSYYASVGHMPFWEAPERFNSELRELAASAHPGA
jgi:non-heme chloroperoxidase